jgi:type IV pilus assembly protein PilM
MVKIKGKSLIGLDIGTKVIKAIEIGPTENGFGVIGYAYKEIPPQTDMKEFIKELFHTAGFKGKKVVTGVSGRSVIVRYINMPEMSDIELQNAIKYEASKYIPFEADEVVLDCQKMDYESKDTHSEEKAAAPNKEMRVILVAAKRNLIEEHLSTLETAGLWPHIIDLDALALGNAFELYQTMAETKGQSESNKCIALIDLGSSKTLLNIVLNNNSYFTREITIAGNDFTDAISKKMSLDLKQAEELKCNPKEKSEEVKDAISGLLEDLIHEIRLSFDYFEHQFEKPIDLIYLSGGSCNLIGLEEVFDKDFQKRPVRWNPTEHLEIASDKITQDELTKNSSNLAIAVGLASRLRKE